MEHPPPTLLQGDAATLLDTLPDNSIDRVRVVGIDPFLCKRRMETPASIVYKYDLSWVKNVPSGMSNSARQPMRQHETSVR